MAFFFSDNLTRAKSDFETVVQKHTGTEYADKSLVGIGRILQGQGELSSAIETYRQVASKRNDDIGAEAQFRIGEALAHQTNLKEAVTQLLRVKYVYPGSLDWIARAYLKLGDCYEKLDDVGKAREAYQSVLHSHKEDEFGKEADKRMKGLK
jgi:TolA-binding protein